TAAWRHRVRPRSTRDADVRRDVDPGRNGVSEDADRTRSADRCAGTRVGRAAARIADCPEARLMAARLDIDTYAGLPDDDCHTRIVEAKARLKGRAVILGHHYQREEVYRHADL